MATDSSSDPSLQTPPIASSPEALPRTLTADAAGGSPGQRLILAPGERPLPEYELKSLLGRGGFGEVWRAAGPGGLDVALKFIRLDGITGDTELRALELIKTIRHAHLLPLFGSWQREGYLILAMELADGTLLQRLEECRAQGLPGIPRDELMEYLREAAKGLDFLNEFRHSSDSKEVAGIQHRDVKPQNLLLVGGSVKIADFGLAKLLDASAATASGKMTPAYTPPELIQGRVTRWSDQYSLAVTYCLLCGGDLPFKGNLAQILAGHATQTPDLSMIPPEERRAVARALDKNPHRRWPTCRAFVESLAVVPEKRKRNLALWLSAAALAGVLALALLLSLGFFRPPSKENGATTSQTPTPSATAAPPSPTAVPRLRLLPVEDTTVVAGESRPVDVRIQRTNCPGPIRLRIEDQTERVAVKGKEIEADQDTAVLDLSAAASASSSARKVRLIASSEAGTEAETEFFLSVLSRRHATLKEIQRLGIVHLWGRSPISAIYFSDTAPPLSSLGLSDAPITDESLAYFDTLTDLRELKLGRTLITDKGLAHLRGLTGLETLSLSENKAITDAGLKHLEGLTNLKDLDVRGTKVTEEGVKLLKNALPKVRIDYKKE